MRRIACFLAVMGMLAASEGYTAHAAPSASRDVEIVLRDCGATSIKPSATSVVAELRKEHPEDDPETRDPETFEVSKFPVTRYCATDLPSDQRNAITGYAATVTDAMLAQASAFTACTAARLPACVRMTEVSRSTTYELHTSGYSDAIVFRSPLTRTAACYGTFSQSQRRLIEDAGALHDIDRETTVDDLRLGYLRAFTVQRLISSELANAYTARGLTPSAPTPRISPTSKDALPGPLRRRVDTRTYTTMSIVYTIIVATDDHDCDGVSDPMDCIPDDPNVGSTALRACNAPCGQGLEECANGAWLGTCSGPSTNSCGTCSETRVCTTAYGNGSERCVDGAWIGCTAPTTCCGDGRCDVGETHTSCPADCREDPQDGNDEGDGGGGRGGGSCWPTFEWPTCERFFTGMHAQSGVGTLLPMSGAVLDLKYPQALVELDLGFQICDLPIRLVPTAVAGATPDGGTLGAGVGTRFRSTDLAGLDGLAWGGDLQWMPVWSDAAGGSTVIAGPTISFRWWQGVWLDVRFLLALPLADPSGLGFMEVLALRFDTN